MRVQGEVSIAIDGMQGSDVIDVGKRPRLLSYIENQSKNSTDCIVRAFLGPKALHIDSRVAGVLNIHIHNGAMRDALPVLHPHSPLPGSTTQLTGPSVAVVDLMSFAASVWDAA